MEGLNSWISTWNSKKYDSGHKLKGHKHQCGGRNMSESKWWRKTNQLRAQLTEHARQLLRNPRIIYHCSSSYNNNISVIYENLYQRDRMKNVTCHKIVTNGLHNFKLRMKLVFEYESDLTDENWMQHPSSGCIFDCISRILFKVSSRAEAMTSLNL
jgi:hypothetical protein